MLTALRCRMQPVIFWAQECPDPTVLLPPEPEPIVSNTDAQGRYEIDYVRDSDCAPLNISRLTIRSRILRND
jgi:hypothetical protein